MKKIFKLLPLLLLIISSHISCFGQNNIQARKKVFNINDYGAVGDNKTVNTIAINKAIDACANAGGGTVFVPEGNYITGTVLLKSNITLLLEYNGNIIGTDNLKEYKSYKLKTEDPVRPINITVKDSAAWCRALVLLDNVHDVTITGHGTIDGSTVVDKQGEEGRRGPHGIFMGDCKNITISNIRVTRAGNYNIVGLGLDNATFTNLTIAQGSDGIHIRRGSNLTISNCKFYTSDDAIAGGYWKNMLIKDCLLNSACNGIRVILPATNLEIKDCEIFGPGVFGHRRGSLSHPLVTRTLTGIILQPGAWGAGPGKLDSINIHDIRIRDTQTAFTITLTEGNSGNHINVERIRATGITRNAGSVEGWPDNSKLQNVRFKDISVSYNVEEEDAKNATRVVRPTTESRRLPYWGWYTRNVKNIEFDNVQLDFQGTEVRPVMGFEKVGEVTLKNVKYKKSRSSKQFDIPEETKVKADNTIM